MDFKFDVNKVLEDLASAFNTTVEYLYPLLVKQAIIDGIITLIVLGIGVIGMISLLWMATKSKNKYNKAHNDSKWEWDMEGVPYIIGTVIFGMVTFVGFLLFLKYGITALLNPEYHMIQKILEQLR